MTSQERYAAGWKAGRISRHLGSSPVDKYTIDTDPDFAQGHDHARHHDCAECVDALTDPCATI